MDGPSVEGFLLENIKWIDKVIIYITQIKIVNNNIKELVLIQCFKSDLISVFFCFYCGRPLLVFLYQ